MKRTNIIKLIPNKYQKKILNELMLLSSQVHRDIIGARNILYKSMYGSIESIHWGEATPLDIIR